MDYNIKTIMTSYNDLKMEHCNIDDMYVKQRFPFEAHEVIFTPR